MSVYPSQVMRVVHVVRDGAGRAVVADALPVGVLYVDGEASDTPVTVKAVEPGVYCWQVTAPRSIGSTLHLKMAATVGDVEAIRVDALGVVRMHPPPALGPADLLAMAVMKGGV